MSSYGAVFTTTLSELDLIVALTIAVLLANGFLVIVGEAIDYFFGKFASGDLDDEDLMDDHDSDYSSSEPIIQHRIPETEFDKHDVSPKCKCKPTKMVKGDRIVYTHNKLLDKDNSTSDKGE
jgi:hypothetical protein